MTVPQRYGITFPFDGMPLLDQREIVRELVDLGYTDLWSAESGGYDAFTPLVVAAQWAPELRFGTAIVRIPAATAALMPFVESSIAAQSFGSTASSRAAARYTSGAGLPFVTSSEETTAAKRSRTPMRSRTSSMIGRFDDDATPSRQRSPSSRTVSMA